MATAVLLQDAAVEPRVEDVGRKAWSLWWMARHGARVPPAFVLPTSACAAYFAEDGELPEAVHHQLRAGVTALEDRTSQVLGGGRDPLLLAVRSSGPVSMPGMMDTLLNVGVNDDVERALSLTVHRSFAAGIHRRFCADYGRTVLRSALDLDQLASTVEVRGALQGELGASVPQDPWAQLEEAVRAVFASSRSRRAAAYRRHHGLPDVGTAVVVQAMVFGDRDDMSGTGVLFTRDPVSGAPDPYGEFQPRSQGEDIVSGRVTPLTLDALAERQERVHAELLTTGARLERAAQDAQEIEFTVERGVLYLLQARTAKRSARAAVRIAVALAGEGLISRRAALDRVTPLQAQSLLRPRLDPAAARDAVVLAVGTPACDGVAVGRAVAHICESDSEGHPVVLVRPQTSPHDVPAMLAAGAIVTEEGGATSHAAVVARSLDKPCVVGCGPGTGTRVVGRVVTVDGTTGRIFDGVLPTVADSVDQDLLTLTQWAREYVPAHALREDQGASATLAQLLTVISGDAGT